MASSENSFKARRQPTPAVPQHTIDHFKAIPWTRPTLDDEAFKPIPMSRGITHEGRGHTLMAKTWNTEDTIKDLLTLHRPCTSPTPLSFPQSESERAENRRFYTFGKDLNAHPDLLHGGVISCILDSSLGGAVEMALRDPNATNPTYTVQLNVTYKKPVRTPGTIMVRAWVTRAEGNGRKVWAHGVVEGEGGVLHALADGMWLRAKEKL